MAIAVETQINTYPVEAYRVIESVVFTKRTGGVTSVIVQHADYPSVDAARRSAELVGQGKPGLAFNKRTLPVNPEPTPLAPLVVEQPDGSRVITPVPDLPAYRDLVGAPLGSWLTLGDGETLDSLSMHDLVYRLGYLVAGKIPDNASGEKV